jgi:hypothetical protein
MPSVPVLTVIKEAYQELNVFQPGATIPAPQLTFALSKANQLIDNWNAERAKVWAEIFTQFNLTPNLSPHTIGPSGATFTMAIRPVTLDGCSLNLNTSTPNVFVGIDIISWEEYQGLSVPGISTSIPTVVYYETDWPKGKLFFYPIPNYAYPVRLATRTLLGVLAIGDSIDFPPGYQEAFTLTLTEAIATATGRAVPAQTAKNAQKARARIETNNQIVPLLDLRDGQQEQPGGKSTWNYHSRTF